jgi:hypothetical protein
MAESVGVNTAAYKIFIFTYAAIITGLSGWLSSAHTRRKSVCFVPPLKLGPFRVNGYQRKSFSPLPSLCRRVKLPSTSSRTLVHS